MNETKNWHSKTDSDGIVWLCIDVENASANLLSKQVMSELMDILAVCESDPPRGLVIYSGKNNGFIMGADINEFTKIKSAEKAYELIRLGQQVLERLETLQCPTVAVINGFALGGGLELALACDYRLVLRNNKPILGMPEVKLGLHPGFGGTVRAVQVIGVRAAMQLMLTGKAIRANKAIRQGLIDQLTVPDNWRQAAKEFIYSQKSKSRAKLLDRIMNCALFRPFIVSRLLNQVRSRTRREHYPAPFAIIDLWAKYGASPKVGYEAEARSMANLIISETSRNLVRIFFLQNKLKSQGNKTKQEIARVHVIGAGIMGGDIAAWCALRGMKVTLQDREIKYIEPAIERANKLFKKKISGTNDREETIARLNQDVDGIGIADADLIIEAIFENLDAKQELFKKIESAMKPGAILATNTSSIRLEELRTVLQKPERFIGLHFFNPVAMLPLVEIIKCTDTEEDVLDAGFAFVKLIGKIPLQCTSSPGFVVNRILAPYTAEAIYLAESGVPLTEIDKAAEEFGMPMGPIKLIDTIGIDVVFNVSKILGDAFNRPVPDCLAIMMENNKLGRKSGQGFYRWHDGKVVKNDENNNKQSDLHINLQDRLILPMLNEAVACLHEGVVDDADMLDAGVILGTGFAPFRGGPLNYAKNRGIRDIQRILTEFSAKYGDRFLPHEGWSNLDDT